MRVGSVEFQPDWKTSLLTACLFPFLVSLGLWQLDREQEKLAILDGYADKETQLPVDLVAQWGPVIADNDIAFTPVSVRGRFDNSRTLLLDNRIQNGKVGFELIQAFVLQQDMVANVTAGANYKPRVAWVNRGWIQAPRYRADVPVFDLIEGIMTIKANVYVSPGDSVVLADSAGQRLGPYRLVQTIDMATLLGEEGGEEVFPHLLRLQALSTAALSVNWVAVNSEPAKHRGYAVQWFIMAFALVVFYLLISSTRIRDDASL